MKKRIKNHIIFSILSGLSLFYLFPVYGQNEPDKWDNQFFVGNKISWGFDNWKFSGELQTRLKSDFQQLDRWFLEGTTSYLVNKNWEIVAPLRFSVTQKYSEWRPGIGVLYKMYPHENLQIVHQLQWQVDIDPEQSKNGLRYVAFVNYIKNKKLIPNFAAGIFQRWQNDFTGIQFIRVGGGLAWILDVKHSINFSYFIGMTNTGENWVYQGIPFIQLVININKDYKYVPASYINF